MRRVQKPHGGTPPQPGERGQLLLLPLVTTYFIPPRQADPEWITHMAGFDDVIGADVQTGCCDLGLEDVKAQATAKGWLKKV